MLVAVPKQSIVEHKPVCSIDGEPWPCFHTQKETHYRMTQHYSVLCVACGKLRNAWASLDIESDLENRHIYFHARKPCAAKAKIWWDENIKPHTGEDLFISILSGVTIGGQWIGDLTRHLAARTKMKAV